MRKFELVTAIATLAIANQWAMCYTTFRSDRRAGTAEVRCRDKELNFGRPVRDCISNGAHLTPHWAFDYSKGGSLMGCPNMIAMCAKSHQACPHAKYDGNCSVAECANATIPTFRQMFEIYKSTTSSAIGRIKRVESVMRRLPVVAGLSYDDKAALSEIEWQAIYEKLKDGTHKLEELDAGIRGPKRHIGAYDPATIAAYFDIFRACAGVSDKKIRLEYKRRGLTPPDCDTIPEVDFSGKSRDIEMLTLEQIRIVKDKMVLLANAEKHKRANHTRFLRLFFGLYFGVRPGDIHRLTWDCIEQDPYGAWWLRYTPHKTEKKTGRKGGGRIDPRLIVKLRPFIRKYDLVYVIPRHAHMIRSVKTGENASGHKALENWVNAFMRDEVGVKGRMASYLLRRDCSKWTIENEGVLAEAQKLCHTPTEAFRSYTDISKINTRMVEYKRAS